MPVRIATTSRPLRGRLPGAAGIPIDVPAIDPNALPPKHHSLLQPRPPKPCRLGAHMWAEWLRHPFLLGRPQHGDRKWEKRGDDWETQGKTLPGAPGVLTYSQRLLATAPSAHTHTLLQSKTGTTQVPSSTHTHTHTHTVGTRELTVMCTTCIHTHTHTRRHALTHKSTSLHKTGHEHILACCC